MCYQLMNSVLMPPIAYSKAYEAVKQAIVHVRVDPNAYALPSYSR